MPETAAHVEKILGGISLPSCPAILMSIMSESRKDEPDFNQISDLVSSDAGISASVLKLVNSPAFRRSTNIGSIRQAVAVLGLKKVMLAVNAMFLRSSVTATHPAAKVFLEKFWEKSSHTAASAMKLAKLFPGVSGEDAYTLGLFHDSGVPVLMQRFPELALDSALYEADWESIHRNEETKFGTNHAIVGNLLARNWGLPAHICQTILHHHDLGVFTNEDHPATSEVRNFIAVLILAEHLVGVFMNTEDKETLGKAAAHAHAFEHLGLEHDEFSDIANDIWMELGQDKV
ncbi:MAG: HDOD domain-containing protein [Sideroxyarcus sp.]